MFSYLVGIWWIGVFATLIVMPYRCGGNLTAYATVFAHEPSRRNGLPWLARTVGKALVWPYYLYQWNQAGRPPTPVLYGPDAAVALGIDPSTLSYGTNAFATMWQRPPGATAPGRPSSSGPAVPPPPPTTGGSGLGPTWPTANGGAATNGGAAGRPASIRAAGAVLDDAWFDRWFDSILRESGVAPDDGQNRVQLTVFTLGAMDSAAFGFFEQRGDLGTRATYERLCSTGASAGARWRFLVEWNPASRDPLAERLDKHHDLLVQGGRTHGRMRFFPSACCGKPTEYSGPELRPFCSECRNPV